MISYENENDNEEGKRQREKQKGHPFRDTQLSPQDEAA
jgi:hypothetical protein